MPPDPQQAIEIDPRSDDRRQVEAVESIDDGCDFAAARGRRDHLQQQRGAPRRLWTGDFRQFPARQPAGEHRIERGGARGRNEPLALTGLERGGERAIELADAKGGFEGGGSRVRHIFALCSPYYIPQPWMAIKKRK